MKYQRPTIIHAAEAKTAVQIVLGSGQKAMLHALTVTSISPQLQVQFGGIRSGRVISLPTPKYQRLTLCTAVSKKRREVNMMTYSKPHIQTTEASLMLVQGQAAGTKQAGGCVDNVMGPQSSQGAYEVDE